jgi:sensor histidine kinase YesM
MKSSFKKELQRDITIRFGILSIIVSGILMVLFASLIFFVQNYQLTTETNSISQKYKEIERENFQVLQSLNKQLIPSFLHGNRTERELFSEYYSQIAQNEQRGELLITNNVGEVQFTTNESWTSSMVAQNYLKTVIYSNPSLDKMTRITTDSNKNHYLILFQKIEHENQFEGYSILFLNGNDFMQQNISNGTQYVIADQYNNVFSRSSNQFIQSSLEKIDTQALTAANILLLDKHIFLTNQTVLTETITLYTYIPFVPIQLLLMLMLLSTFILTTVLFSQSFRLAKKIAERNSTSIDQLVLETNLITHGYKTQISVKTDDEFGYLANQINHMLNELNHLYEKMLTLEKQSVQFERKMLEAQFNPHFLYNTLETIRITIPMMPKTSIQLIHALNRVLKYSISEINQETTLKQDLSILEDFLEVNSIRFEKLTYQITCDPTLDSLKIPRLCLLPLIENSLKYGMKVRNDLFIHVNCYQISGKQIFEITDNGAGFEQEALKNIQKQIQKKHTHHGLINSYRRLEMFFHTVKLDITRKNEQTIIKFIIEEDRNV